MSSTSSTMAAVRLLLCFHFKLCQGYVQSLITQGWLLCIIDIGTDQVLLISIIADKCLMIRLIVYSIVLLHVVQRKWHWFNWGGHWLWGSSESQIS